MLYYTVCNLSNKSNDYSSPAVHTLRSQFHCLIRKPNHVDAVVFDREQQKRALTHLSYTKTQDVVVVGAFVDVVVFVVVADVVVAVVVDFVDVAVVAVVFLVAVIVVPGLVIVVVVVLGLVVAVVVVNVDPINLTLKFGKSPVSNS